ncbi:hypothetical protein F4810DRAFT_653867 [Camillea tinctor]|nr:hypothetical protein F4810DRAFT_653867 [Camillea tinctor]
MESPCDTSYDKGVNHEGSPKTHGIKKILYVLPSYVKASLEKGEDGYKGTERSAVYTLSEFARRGIETHLIAPKGSNIQGVELHESCDTPHWDFSDPKNPITAPADKQEEVLDKTIQMMKQLVKELKPDVVDCHIAHKENMDQALWHLPVPSVVNFHGPTKGMEDLRKTALKTPRLPVITVSELQQKCLPGPNYVGVVPNGMPKDVIPFQKTVRKVKQLVMLGRLSPKKDFPRGIAIAKRAGMHLVIGGTLLNDQRDQDYFKTVLDPLLKKEADHVTLREDVVESNKAEFLAGSEALLALTKRSADEWGPEYIEADGMHITEALAAGVPVICDSGVDPSKVPDGVVGFYCNNDEEIYEALKKINTISGDNCRRHYLDNYTVDKAVDKRLEIYVTLKRDFQSTHDEPHVPESYN